MPWLDMPTLLPVQMMTQSSIHYLWFSLKEEEKFEGNGKQRMFKSPIINK